MVAVSVVAALWLPLESLPAPAVVPGSNGLIAFASTRTGDSDIFVMHPDGSGQTNLTNNPAADRDPAWSPDGTKIAFESDRSGGPEIWVMNADGSDPTQLTSLSAYAGGPAWSPDGTRIAFHASSGGSWEVFVMNADGSGLADLTNNSGQDMYPSWSPDGTRIAFQSFRNNDWDVFAMSANGSGQTNLTNRSGTDERPEWSPDGTKIVFASDGGVADPNIWVMNANGTGQTNLTNTVSDSEDMPSWSPDGSRITYRNTVNTDADIYVMNADGSAQTDVSNAPSSDESGPDWQSLHQPMVLAFRPSAARVGRTVYVIGGQFTFATAVFFHGEGSPVPASFVVLNDQEILARVPSGALTGPVEVQTATGDGVSAIDFKVKPKVKSFSPASGPVGTTVTIQGSALTGATKVTFGGVAAGFTVQSYSTITATVPMGAATGLIIVRTPGGQAKSATNFTVT